VQDRRGHALIRTGSSIKWSFFRPEEKGPCNDYSDADDKTYESKTMRKYMKMLAKRKKRKKMKVHTLLK
jgi:hypothetical protein